MGKKSITILEEIPGTADLKPPKLELTYEVESSGSEEHERVKFDYIVKNFESAMRKKFRKQIDAFAVPLQSMQKDIDKLRTAYNTATTATDPFKLKDEIDKAIDLKKALDDQLKDYASYLSAAVSNMAQQQILAWAPTLEKEAEDAAKKKIKSDIKWKKVRHVMGAVVKGTLILGGAAAAIALSVATLGAATPLIAAVGVAFASMGGLQALYKVGTDIKGKYDLEKRALVNLENDLKAVLTHLGSILSKTAGMPKHLDDASRLCTERRVLIQETRSQLDELGGKAKEADAKLGQLKSLGDLKGIAKQAATVKKIAEEQVKAQKFLDSALARDKAFEDFIDKARVVMGDLTKIPVVPTRTLVESMKQYVNTDLLATAVDSVSSIGKLGAAMKAS